LRQSAVSDDAGAAVKLTPDLIYEAALDDDLFAELPSIVATALEARSCVLHWRDQDGAAEISTHSGYFSNEQMTNYACNFVGHDLWTEAGMRQGFVNRAWRTTDLVPTKDYERSIFYNEWIRAMGDDTLFCCGSVMRTPHGDGIIGLHRGKGQSDFSDRLLHDLNRNVEHLRRLFAIRGKIAMLTKRNDLLSAMLGSDREATFAVGSGGRILLANHAADAMFLSGRFLRCRSGQVRAVSDASRRAFEAALAAAVQEPERQASSCLLRSDDGAVLIASLTPLPSSFSQPAVLVTVDDERSRMPPQVISTHLQDAFGLSPAEADIAIRLTDGATIREISDRRGSTLGTVRIQVKAVLSKMGARRQGDVVRTVGRLSHGRAAGGSMPETDDR
jgi:DNA-binding CsgD family transcriptional regulator